MEKIKYKKNKIKAELIKYSVNDNNDKLATFLLDMPRILLAELNTHKIMVRNAQSSRAVPIVSVVEILKDNYFEPIFWGKKQSGMSADNECNEPIYDDNFGAACTRETYWNYIKEFLVEKALNMDKSDYHKQIVGRILEPFQMIRVLYTATEWDNFFNLRIHKSAQPEFRDLAIKIYVEKKRAIPERLKHGEYHLPFVKTDFMDGQQRYFDENDNEISIQDAIKISLSCNAQTSYRKQNESLEKAEDINKKLFGDEVVHCFDDETEILTSKGFVKIVDLSTNSLVASVDNKTGKFIGFSKPLDIITEDYEGMMYRYNQNDYDAMITPNHRIYGKLIRKAIDRKQIDYDYELFEAKDETTNRCKYKTKGEMEHLVPIVPKKEAIEEDKNYTMGQLHGFFVGDGHKPTVGKNVTFRLKRKRKIEYVRNIFKKLKIDFLCKIDKNGVYTFRFKDVEDFFRSAFYDVDGKKKLKEDFMNESKSYMLGLYDGLKNSDGSVKRKTIVYCTNSEKLARQFEMLCIITGIGSCGIECNSKGFYRIMVRTKKHALVNDSRKNSRVELVPYKGKICCVTVDGNVIIVKRNGKVYLSGNSSPSEHIATPMKLFNDFDYVYPYKDTETEISMWEDGVTHMDKQGNLWSGQFKGWIQHRQMIPNNVCWNFSDDDFYRYTEDLDLSDY